MPREILASRVRGAAFCLGIQKIRSVHSIAQKRIFFINKNMSEVRSCFWYPFQSSRFYKNFGMGRIRGMGFLGANPRGR